MAGSDAVATPRDDTSARAGRHDGPVLAITVAVVAGLIGGAVLIGRHLWFFADEWNVFGNYPQGELLKPFNGHLSLIPVGIYQLLYATVGVGSHLPFRLAGLLALAVLAFQVARYAHARLGWSAAALATAAILWNSSGSSNVLFPFLLNFTIPLAAMFSIWWHLDRGDALAASGGPRTRSDVAASIWLAVALASSALGIMVLIAVAVELGLRRAPLRRWLTFSPGVVLWAAWYATNREHSKIATDPGAVVAYAWRMFLGATTSLAAGWTPGGALLAAAFLVVLGVAVLRWRTVDARAVAALSAPVVFIGVTTVTRLPIIPYIPPDELRYAWTVALYLVAVVVAVWPRRREASAGIVPDAALDPDAAIPAGPVVRRSAVVVAAVVLALGAVVLVDGMRSWARMVESATPGVRAALFAAEAVGPRRGDQDVILPLSYVPVTNGEYLHGVATVGSPITGMDPVAFRSGHPDQLHSADRLLVQGLPIRTTSAPPRSACAPGPAHGAVRVPAGSVVAVRDDRTGTATGATTVVRVARFARPADGIDVPVVAVAGAAVGWLHVPADAPGVRGAAVPYRVLVPVGVEVCVTRDG